MKRRTIQHYEFIRKIGAGGSGVVFLATDTLLQRPVVLKLLKRGALSIEQMRTTQLREARLASAIDHPNVCAIYEVGEVASDETGGIDEAYIVMQYIPGKSLDKIIAQGPSSLQLVLSAGIQISDGLAAAHSLGIFHRDLKPANVMLTDGGLIKILDFGLARRINPDQAEFDPAGPTKKRTDGPNAVPGPTYTARGGTIAYMAPEQFVTGQSSVQSDIFALGLILYELATGRHPFHRPDAPEFQSIRAIQYADPPPIREIAPNLPVELESVILHCLEKQPSARFASAADVRESLKTIMMAMKLDRVGMPGDAISLLPSQGRLPLDTPEEEKRTTGILSMLAERFRESSNTAVGKQNSIVVLPFVNFGPADVAPLYGYALADAIAARLARMPSLVVRPSSALMAVSTQQLDPLSVGKKLLVHFVLAGNFLRLDKGFDLNWQLLDVPSQSVRAGGSINVASFDLVSVQSEICNEVFSTLQGFGDLHNYNETTHRGSSTAATSLGAHVSEEYLQARAVLSSFMSRTGSRDDLDRARELFESVIKQDNVYAPGWSGLGITHLQYARHGLGGQMHVLEARRAFDKALELDPGSVEANLYRVYMLLSRGEKESARHGIEHLLQTAANDWNVHLVAGQTLRIDGMYEEALDQFNISLRMNPSNAALIYNNRARVYQYQNQMELAADEIEKGLTLEPKQPLLRISLGYQQMRIGDLTRAIDTLEAVTRDEKSLRIVYPTIALCYVQLGERAKAASFIVDETLSAAEADSEMAYRLATYFALEGDESEALHWLRRAIYLGNENYPWFSINPAWRKLGGHSDFERILEDLKKSYRRNQKNWKRLLSQIRD